MEDFIDLLEQQKQQSNNTEIFKPEDPNKIEQKKLFKQMFEINHLQNSFSHTQQNVLMDSSPSTSAEGLHNQLNKICGQIQIMVNKQIEFQKGKQKLERTTN